MSSISNLRLGKFSLQRRTSLAAFTLFGQVFSISQVYAWFPKQCNADKNDGDAIRVPTKSYILRWTNEFRSQKPIQTGNLMLA